jgi:hypothetical protein
MAKKNNETRLKIVGERVVFGSVETEYYENINGTSTPSETFKPIIDISIKELKPLFKIIKREIDKIPNEEIGE